MSLPRKSDPSEIQEFDGQDNKRVYDPSNNTLLQELIEEIRAFHTTFKQVHNIEV